MDTEIAVALITGGVTVINIVFSSIMSHITKKQASQSNYQEEVKTRLREYDDRIENLEKGLQSLLRIEIIRSHDKYLDKGYCPVYAKESLSRAYHAYHKLGGNDVATELYQTTISLPTEPPNSK